MEKHFIDSQTLLQDSFQLAKNIYQDEFIPDFIIGIWRGGAPIAMTIQEFFNFKGINVNHLPIKVSSYQGINQQNKNIVVDGISILAKSIKKEDSVLLVDDIFDSGRSIKALLDKMKSVMEDDFPLTVKVACPWYKPTNNQVNFMPDYYLHTSDKWLVFPHELSGLTFEELKNNKPAVLELLTA